jgi:hypothetical protein
MRIKLAEMMATNVAYLDVGLIKTTNNMPRFDPVKGLGLIEVKALPVQKMDMQEQSKYKYIIHLDGNVAAYRLLKTMLLGSVILKVEGKYDLWVEQLLQDGVNYISVKEDLSDLIEKIEWCKSHDEECKTIAENGTLLAKKVLDKNYINDSFIKILRGVKNVASTNIFKQTSPDFPPPQKAFVPHSPDEPPPGRFTPHSPDEPPPGRFTPHSPDEPPPGRFTPHSPDEPPPGRFTPHSPDLPTPPQTILEVENQKEESSEKSSESESNPESQNSDTKAVKFAEEPEPSSSNSNETRKIIL